MLHHFQQAVKLIDEGTRVSKIFFSWRCRYLTLAASSCKTLHVSPHGRREHSHVAYRGNPLAARSSSTLYLSLFLIALCTVSFFETEHMSLHLLTLFNKMTFLNSSLVVHFLNHIPRLRIVRVFEGLYVVYQGARSCCILGTEFHFNHPTSLSSSSP